MIDDPEQTPAGLMFSQDLFFGSKVTGTANAMGFRVELLSNIPDGLAKLTANGYRCAILDLAMPGLAPATVMATVSELPSGERPVVIAFGSHVHTTRLEQARDAGCDDVMPRSRFSGELVQILSRYCGPKE